MLFGYNVSYANLFWHAIKSLCKATSTANFLPIVDAFPLFPKIEKGEERRGKKGRKRQKEKRESLLRAIIMQRQTMMEQQQQGRGRAEWSGSIALVTDYSYNRAKGNVTAQELSTSNLLTKLPTKSPQATRFSHKTMAILTFWQIFPNVKIAALRGQFNHN